jgi:hypothetical protein
MSPLKKVGHVSSSKHVGFPLLFQSKKVAVFQMDRRRVEHHQ